MRADGFRAWLRENRGLVANTISTYISVAKRIERSYGETLENLYAKDGFDSILEDLQYTYDDYTNRAPGRAPISTSGSPYHGYRVYRSVLNRYRAFLDDAPRAHIPLPNFTIFERDGRWHWNLHGLGRHGIIARGRKDGYADKRSAIAATHHLVTQATRARNRFDFRM